jgi:hypothetical protein
MREGTRSQKPSRSGDHASGRGLDFFSIVDETEV